VQLWTIQQLNPPQWNNFGVDIIGDDCGSCVHGSEPAFYITWDAYATDTYNDEYYISSFTPPDSASGVSVNAGYSFTVNSSYPALLDFEVFDVTHPNNPLSIGVFNNVEAGDTVYINLGFLYNYTYHWYFIADSSHISDVFLFTTDTQPDIENNTAPYLVSASPEGNHLYSSTVDFTASVIDPDGDMIGVRWYCGSSLLGADTVQNGTASLQYTFNTIGDTITYTIVVGDGFEQNAYDFSITLPHIDTVATEEEQISDNIFIGIPVSTWYAVFGVGMCLFFFILPSLVSQNFRHPIPKEVNIFSGVIGVVGCTLFGLFPLWILFIFALLIVAFVILKVKR